MPKNARVALSQRKIDRLTGADTEGKSETWFMDEVVRGLGVRLLRSGSKTYMLRYYNDRGQGVSCPE